MEPNDIAGLVARCAGIRLVACNGGAAFRLYRRWILPGLPQMPVVPLPSTSPAHAGMSFVDKARKWREALGEYIRR